MGVNVKDVNQKYYSSLQNKSFTRKAIAIYKELSEQWPHLNNNMKKTINQSLEDVLFSLT